MNVHGITDLLTFNRDDFTRYPGITVLFPIELRQGPLQPRPDWRRMERVSATHGKMRPRIGAFGQLAYLASEVQKLSSSPT
jgi:hypothetical protein